MTLKPAPLGKGLAALLGDWQPNLNEKSSDMSITVLPIHELEAGQYQPRQHFDETQLQELAQSIQKQGLIQPLTVRPKGDKYEIIAGERRWRACQLIGKTEVPVIVQHVSDETALALALIENLQRQNLNAIEEAHALQRLIDEFSLTHQQIAEILGHSRGHISNQLRLLQLEPEVQTLLAQGHISVGHARCLVGLDTNTQIEVAEKIHQQQWSVRTTEKWLQSLNQTPLTKTQTAPKAPQMHSDIVFQLKQKWPATFEIKGGARNSGKLIINYKNAEGLETILQHLMQSSQEHADA
jgi:ParB family transcriptional regulator, chromosome partitioning protein